MGRITLLSGFWRNIPNIIIHIPSSTLSFLIKQFPIFEFIQLSFNPTTYITHFQYQKFRKNSHNKRLKLKMKVKIRTWNAVATWRWDLDEDDVCGICQVHFDGTCPTCKYPGDDCSLCILSYLFTIAPHRTN